MRPLEESRFAQGTDGPPGGSRGLVVHGALAAVAALASMAVVSDPTSPDPNSWLVWADQVASMRKVDLGVGPSWKPLPVMVSIPWEFLSPGLAAWVWVFVIRAAAVMSAFLAWSLVAPRYGRLAGLVGAVLPWSLETWNDSWLKAESEPLFVVLVLGSLLALRSAKRSVALALLLAAGLLRPEIWPAIPVVLLLTGAGHRRWQAGWFGLSAVDIGGAWFGLPWLMGNAPLQAADRVVAPSAYSRVGLWDGALSFMPLVAAVLVPVGFAALWRGRDRILAGLAIGSVIYAAEVIVGARVVGYTEVSRYFLPAMFGLLVIAGPGAGFLVSLGRQRAVRQAIGAVIALAVAASLVPAALHVAERIPKIRTYHAGVDAAVASIDRLGGVERFSGCSPFAAPPLYLRVLARELGVPLQGVVSSTAAPTVAFEPMKPAGFGASAPQVAAAGSQPELLAVTTEGWRVVRYAKGSRCQ